MNFDKKPNKFQNASKQIQFIANAYINVSHFLGAKDSLRSRNEFENYSYSSFIERVNCAFDKLDPLEKKIINNEFFYNDYSYWWEKDYAYSTFHRLKSNAMRKFLRFYNYEKD